MRPLERPAQDSVFTMALEEVRLKDVPLAGGKAVHLGEMLAAGLPVPSGFVVTTSACREFMQSEPRVGECLERLQGCEPCDAATLREVAGEISERLGAVAMPGLVADAIAAALVSEPDAARAVRSSATAEDMPEASFAGQHDSFLNVRGRDAVLAAVKRCWLSLFSERAISYRMRKGISADGAQMAVIVQQLVAADAAGVMFTGALPGGDSDSILIEAAFGLGEAVVQGRVAPDRVEVSRSGLRVVRRETGVKKVQIVAAREGVFEEPVPDGKANASALDDEASVQLARLGLEAERILGGPLDIEWGQRDGEIWLLQARAVTGLARGTGSGSVGNGFEERQIWTNANTGEVFPDVMTPMTWSFLRRTARELFNRFLRPAGFRFHEGQLFRRIAGRVYFNFNTIFALGRRIPGAKNLSMETLVGGRQDAMLALKRFELAEADLPRIGLDRWRAAIGLSTLVLRFFLFSARRAELSIGAARRATEEFSLIESGALPDDELVTEIRAAFIPPVLKTPTSLDAVGVGLGYIVILFDLCERWFGPEGRGIVNRLLAGVGDLDSAATGHDLWRLAEQAASEPDLKAALFGGPTFAAVAHRLQSCRTGPAFLAGWNSFMSRHGHHTRGEVELFNSRWSECPDFVLDLVRGYVEAIGAGHPSPLVRQKTLARERVALATRCLEGLRNPLKRAIFRLALFRAQKGLQFRENTKSELVRWLALLRRFLLELGRRLAAHGRIAEPNDVFFLEMDELKSGVVKETETDLRALVAGRRAQYERDLKTHPPPVIVGRFDADSFMPESVEHGKKVFHGLGVSAGIATGRARVILRSDANERVQPGEILVAPFTDPGWTPYFVAAAGIVMDLGGMLSHGSIVAREYGIPAVVNVGPATQVIRTGQRLEVDGDRGIVRVLEEEPGG